MADEVLDETPDTEQISGDQPESGAVDKTAVVDDAGASGNKEAETDDQKNERVAREAAEAAQRKQEKRRQSVDRRFAELTFEKKEAIRRSDELAAQNARLLEAVLAGKGGTAAVSTEGEPKPEQFTDYNDYVRALARFEAKQVAKSETAESVKASTEAQQRQAQEQAIAREHATYAERARQAAKSLPDFAEVMEDASSVDIPPKVLGLIRKMPDGPTIAYHMVKNPQLAEQFFNTDDPEMHGILLGQISATIKGPAKVSNAPPPGKGIRATPSAGSAAPEDPDAYMAWRAKNLR